MKPGLFIPTLLFTIFVACAPQVHASGFYLNPWFVNPGVTFTKNGFGGELSFGRNDLNKHSGLLWGGVLQYEPEMNLFQTGVEAGLMFFLVEGGYAMGNTKASFYAAPTLSFPVAGPWLVMNGFYRHYFQNKDLGSLGVSLKLPLVTVFKAL